MIVGRGDLASVLPDDDRFLFFASGVSNSRETRESEYSREWNLLFKQDLGQHVVYFSSLAVLSGEDTRYIRHKKQMEKLVKGLFPRHTIVRIGNISWGTNPHTLINFVRNQFARGEEPVIQDVYRYVVDEEEFLHWVSLIPLWTCEINIPGRRLKVAEIVELIRKGEL